ncbi:hypothetical protein JCM10207_005104 [Rhodosporidiobolus poonsookiae]
MSSTDTQQPPTLPPPVALANPATPPTPEPAAAEDHSFPPPQQTEQAAPLPAQNAVPPALAVRLSLLRRMYLGLVEMQGPRRRRFAFFTFAGFAQIVAFSVILGLTYGDPCDKPLGIYLILVIIRIAVAFPISFWQSVNVRPNRGTEEQRAAYERNRRLGNARIDHNVRRFTDMVSLLSLVLFFFGNYWLISEQTCHMSAPVLYKTALAALIISWLWTAEFVLYAILIILFLPFFLIGVRWFGLGQAKNEIGPLSKTDIESLPKRLFVGTLPSDEDDAAATPETPAGEGGAAGGETAQPAKTDAKDSHKVTVAPASTRAPKRQFWRLWRRNGKSAGGVSNGAQVGEFVPFPPGIEPVLLPASQSACSICLCEYELPPLRTDPAAASSWKPDDELLRLLPCQHAFHSACLADWLAVSGRCPLCQRAVNEGKAKKGKGGRGRGGAAGGGAGGADAAGQQV